MLRGAIIFLMVKTICKAEAEKVAMVKYSPFLSDSINDKFEMADGKMKYILKLQQVLVNIWKLYVENNVIAVLI